ncbi:MAG: SagB/ThcOx family dehydrogenase [Deltaproteobacteria bacterium]|nr:SagB/ThcOx family dehydrogenase [Deltaproteobacteria bacterium]
MRPCLLLALATLCVLPACRKSPLLSADPLPDSSRSLATAASPALPAASAPIALPPADLSGSMTLERALVLRHSVREFEPHPMSPAQLSQLAWAAQGMTDATTARRTSPSAGATYPMEVYFATADGVSHYIPGRHAMQRISTRDVRRSLTTQQAVAEAPCVIVLTTVTERTRKKYGERAERYVAMEAGHIGQNVLLQATAMGLGGVPVGGFDGDKAREVLALDKSEEPLYILAIGKPAAK